MKRPYMHMQGRLSKRIRGSEIGSHRGVHPPRILRSFSIARS